jgi:hypothetical protein
MGDGGNGGPGGDANSKPFCASLEAQQDCSAVRNGDGGVSLMQERCGSRFFV